MIQSSVVILTILTALVVQAYSKGVQHNLKHCIDPGPRYKRIEDFTVEWFQDNIRPEVLNRYQGRDPEAPFHNSLFYTRGMSETAKVYACHESLITIWEPWDAALYNDSTGEENEYSCIHHSNATRNMFYERMSEAFAAKTSGSVYVMHSLADYHKPPMDGIWGKIEQKVLRERKIVVKISKQSGTDKSTVQVIWDVLNGWVAGCFDQPELKWKLRNRGEATQKPFQGNKQAANPSCQWLQLPVYNLPVNW
ncbi:hypothetical protein C7974DRAFT_389408 [Boeremia exigua]|uniref:uncharacterized protein n=1 Tax=Boeremia exigua TaxID=749465 RepID=UPI001E8E95F3|nr:uncharacterized protein C7974DRAFT_389408 [Boeremia exigua]KAH6637384.1 hypothetical protein C7974DRAFT_389408 [Boeremia exigua]